METIWIFFLQSIFVVSFKLCCINKSVELEHIQFIPVYREREKKIEENL